VGGQHHASAALPTGKTRYLLYRRLGGPQGRSGRVRQISPPPAFDPRTVQPVASRYWLSYPAHASYGSTVFNLCLFYLPPLCVCGTAITVHLLILRSHYNSDEQAMSLLGERACCFSGDSFGGGGVQWDVQKLRTGQPLFNLFHVLLSESPGIFWNNSCKCTSALSSASQIHHSWSMHWMGGYVTG
jgi:hypothetical protein